MLQEIVRKGDGLYEVGDQQVGLVSSGWVCSCAFFKRHRYCDHIKDVVLKLEGAAGLVQFEDTWNLQVGRWYQATPDTHDLEHFPYHSLVFFKVLERGLVRLYSRMPRGDVHTLYMTMAQMLREQIRPWAPMGFVIEASSGAYLDQAVEQIGDLGL